MNTLASTLGCFHLGADMGRDQSAANGNPVYLIYVLSISILGILILAAGVMLKANPAIEALLGYADMAICGLFFVDFVITIIRAPNRWRYLVTWGWLDILSSIPLVPGLRVGRLARIFRIVRVLRGIRSVRVLTRFILEHRAQSAMTAAGLLSLVLVFFGSVAILQFEQGPTANIKGPEDALWWSIVTLTTVGYGDRFPVTTEGRVVAVVLMLCGVGLFGMLSGFVASWFLQPEEKDQEDEIALLRKELQSMNERLSERGPHV